MIEDLFLQQRVAPNSPKQMNLKEISVKFAMEKNKEWHSRLPITNQSNMVRNSHKVFYGAEYLDHCFAVAMWTTPIARRLANQKIYLELRRLAISPDAPKFTATWMIGKMVKNIKKKFPEIKKLVSYQDLDVHSGTIYAAANWKKDNITKGAEWSVPSRARKKSQTISNKARWVYEI